jgi:BMFP domain-containing protein YqiC
MAHSKIISFVDAAIAKAQAQTEADIVTALDVVEEEFRPLEAKLTALEQMLEDLGQRIEKLEAK